jgi:hypothetical protein
MEDLWYWQSKLRVYGPLTTEELETLVRQGKMSDSDCVRLDNSDEWIAGADIRQMFATTETPAEVAAGLLASAAQRRLLASGAVESSERKSRRALAGVCDALSAVCSSIRERFADFCSVIGRTCGKRLRVIAVAILGLALLGAAVKQILRHFTSDRPTLEQIVEAWNEFQLLDSSDGSKRNAFVAERLPWLISTIASLEKQAFENPIASNPWIGPRRELALARRELLFACRGLKDILAAETSSELQRLQISASLEQARKYLDGHAAIPPRSAADNSDGLFAAAVVVSVLCLVGGTMWWLRVRQASS